MNTRTGAIIAPAGIWTDDLAEKLIKVARKHGARFARLPDDGTRFEYVKNLFDDSQVFYCISNEERGYGFKAIKHVCSQCRERNVPVKFNAIPVDGLPLAAWWEKSLGRVRPQ